MLLWGFQRGSDKKLACNAGDPGSIPGFGIPNQGSQTSDQTIHYPGLGS